MKFDWVWERGEGKCNWTWGRGSSPFDDDEGKEAEQHSRYNGGVQGNEIITQAQCLGFRTSGGHVLHGFWQVYRWKGGEVEQRF